MAMSDGQHGTVMADINVTPLVDVMLVLLIIFMVTAPMLNQGVDLDLPSESATPLVIEEDQLILSIDRELTYYINDNSFTAEELPSRLKALAEANPGQPIFLKADGDVPYRHVAHLLAEAKRAGMNRVGMVFAPGEITGQEEEPEP